MKTNPVVHFEMPAKNRKRVADFYTKAFGWNMQLLGKDMGNYILATTTPVDNLEKHMKIVTKAGGKILGKPMDIPGIGIFVMFKDSEGNRVGMLQPILM